MNEKKKVKRWILIGGDGQKVSMSERSILASVVNSARGRIILKDSVYNSLGRSPQKFIKGGRK